MKVLITGTKGQLGAELLKTISTGQSELGLVSKQIAAAEVIGVDLEQLDISNLSVVQEYVNQCLPNYIINCAAYTNVDSCEANPEIAFRANALGPRNLAIAAEQTQAKLLHISTDYVFSGTAQTTYQEWDICMPQSVYGKTKLLGEQYVHQFCTRYFIVRTAWLYGYVGHNFVKTMIRLGQEQGAAKVVNDQCGNPTNAVDLAYHILKIIETEEYGIYHCTGNGECSWYEFAREIMSIADIPAIVSPCTTEEFPRPAKRPAYSSLGHTMLQCTVGDEMRPWQEALECYIRNLGDKK